MVLLLPLIGWHSGVKLVLLGIIIMQEQVKDRLVLELLKLGLLPGLVQDQMTQEPYPSTPPIHLLPGGLSLPLYHPRFLLLFLPVCRHLYLRA